MSAPIRITVSGPDGSPLAAEIVKPEPAPAPSPVARDAREYRETFSVRIAPELALNIRVLAAKKKLKLHQLVARMCEVYLREEGEGA